MSWSLKPGIQINRIFNIDIAQQYIYIGIALQYIAKHWYCLSNILPKIKVQIFFKYGYEFTFLIPKVSKLEIDNILILQLDENQYWYCHYQYIAAKYSSAINWFVSLTETSLVLYPTAIQTTSGNTRTTITSLIPWK